MAKINSKKAALQSTAVVGNKSSKFKKQQLAKENETGKNGNVNGVDYQKITLNGNSAGRIIKKKDKLKTLKKKAKKKGKLSISSEFNLKSHKKEDSFHVVPWASRDEWNEVCNMIHEGDFKTALLEIKIWQDRVPTLPVAVESTLFTLEAKLYDDENKDSSTYSDFTAKSLYNIALIRFLNHMGQVAATSIGENTTMAIKELTSKVGIPDWIVTIRNDINHGTTVPSTEILRVSGEFILQWLTTNYWKHPEKIDTSSELFALRDSGPNMEGIGEVISAFIAARIYRFREIQTVNDYEITRHLSDKPPKAKTKAVIVELKTKITLLLQNSPSAVSSVIAETMVPNSDFYSEFQEIFIDSQQTDAFELWYLVWTPIVNLMARKLKLINLCHALCDMLTSNDTNINKELCSNWTCKILETMYESDSYDNYSSQLSNISKKIIASPNQYTSVILSKLSKLLENDLGEEKIRRLEQLAAIWSNAEISSKKPSKSKPNTSHEGFFTVEQLTQNCTKQSSENCHEKCSLDTRDSEFWSNIPMGSMF